MLPTRRHDRPEVWQVALGVAKFSLVIELIGAVLLFLLWLPRFSVGQAAWHAVFHAVSAYCNAGISTFAGNLTGLADDPLFLLVMSFLVILGGLGYLTFEELQRWWRSARAQRSGLRVHFLAPHRLSSHTYAALLTTAVLLLTGTALFALFEWTDTLDSLGVPDKLVNAWFMSVTARTAGFNTVDYGAVGNDTATLTMMLAFVGGSPGSTAGGVKTTTLAVLVALGMSRLRGRKFVAIKDRAIPQGTIERAVGVVLLASLVLVGSFFALGAIESIGRTAIETRQQFLPIAFETVSAFTTLGLSMDVTPTLHPAAKPVVIGLMFVGRVGLLAFFTAITLRRALPPAYLRPAQEDVIIG